MNISDYELVFTGAGQQTIMTNGRFLHIRSADGPVFLSLDGAGEIEREENDHVDAGVENRRVLVRSAIAQTIKITTSTFRQDSKRQSVNVNTTTTIDPSNNFSGVPVKTCLAAGSVQLVAGNANRVRLLVKIATTESGGVWLAGSGSSAGNGYYLEEGESVVLGTTAELWAYGAGVDVDVSVLEEEII